MGRSLIKSISKKIEAMKNWMHDPFFYDIYEALRCPDPTEINRIYGRRKF